MYLIVNDGKLQDNFQQFNDFSPFLEKFGPKDNCHVMKTHLPFEFMPYNSKAKYLTVFRNPKDVCVSSYYHHLHWSKNDNFKSEYSFDEFVDVWLSGELWYNDYF